MQKVHKLAIGKEFGATCKEFRAIGTQVKLAIGTQVKFNKSTQQIKLRNQANKSS
jgi:hypothetical protein